MARRRGMYGDDPDRGSDQGPVIKAVLLTLVACVAVWLIFLRDGDSKAPVVSSAAPTELSETGVAAGFPHTCEGAVGAFTSYYQELNSAEVALNPAKTKTAIDASTIGEAHRNLVENGIPELRRYADGAIGQQYRAGVQTIYRGTPIGWKVNACGRDEVDVQLWTVAVRGNATNVWPMQIWNTHRATLVWEDGDWKTRDATMEDGPVPYWTQSPPASRPTNQRDVMERTEGMNAYVSLP